MAMSRNSVQRQLREQEKPVRIAKVRQATNTTTMAAAASVSVDKPLTDKQKLFAKYHAEGDTIPNAMQRAGYNEQPSYGYRMLKMPNVLREIARHQAEYQKATELTKRDVMDMLKESYDMAKLMSEPSSMVSAAREIGKLCGYYEPKKVDVNVTVNGRVQYEKLSDADLFRMIEEAAQAAAAVEEAEDDAEEPPKRLK